jgi:hypothetical protein
MRKHVRTIAAAILLSAVAVPVGAGSFFSTWSAEGHVGTYAWVGDPLPPQSESCAADSLYGGTVFLDDSLFCESQAVYGYAGCTLTLDGWVTGSQAAMTAAASGGALDHPFADCGGSFTANYHEAVAIAVTGNGAVHLQGEVSATPSCTASLTLRNADGTLAEYVATPVNSPLPFDEIVNLPEGANELVMNLYAVPGASSGPHDSYGSASVEVTATASFPVSADAGETLAWSRVKALYR